MISHISTHHWLLHIIPQRLPLCLGKIQLEKLVSLELWMSPVKSQAWKISSWKWANSKIIPLICIIQNPNLVIYSITYLAYTYIHVHIKICIYYSIYAYICIHIWICILYIYTYMHMNIFPQLLYSWWFMMVIIGIFRYWLID